MFVSTTPPAYHVFQAACHAMLPFYNYVPTELTSLPISAPNPLTNLVNINLLTNPPPHPVPHHIPPPMAVASATPYSPCPAYVDNHFQYPFAGRRGREEKAGMWMVY
jgi:hypothetical protein